MKKILLWATITAIVIAFLIYIGFNIGKNIETDNYKLGTKSYNNKNYKKAKEHFSYVDTNHPKIDSAKIFLRKIDSIATNTLLNKGQLYITQINNIKKDKIPESVVDILTEIELYRLFSRYTTEINSLKSKKSIELSKNIISELKSTQRSRLPKMRKKYAQILDQELWEDDINCKTSNKGHGTIRFIGGVFAANKNIKDFQEKIKEQLTTLRFKQSRYMWYKNAEEFTYYDLEAPKDSELYN